MNDKQKEAIMIIRAAVRLTLAEAGLIKKLVSKAEFRRLYGVRLTRISEKYVHWRKLNPKKNSKEYAPIWEVEAFLLSSPEERERFSKLVQKVADYYLREEKLLKER